MGLIISERTETRLTEEARRQGLSVDALLQKLIEDQAVAQASPASTPELPVWHLGAGDALRRRDLYDDVP